MTHDPRPTEAETPVNDLDLDEMRDMAQQLAPYLVRTPVAPLHGSMLAERLAPGTTVLGKLEPWQVTGTFKARGALAQVLPLDEAARARGVTAVSAGNHAIAAAFAARAVGAHAKVVIQSNASPLRVARAAAYGAEILRAEPGAPAFELMQSLVNDEGRTALHPFEGRAVALGTATLGLEFIEEAPWLDAVIVAVGGGGLAAGVASAIHAVAPHCAVYGVEPANANAMQRSLAAGKPLTLPEPPKTVADSLAPPMTLPVSFALCQRHLTEVVTVSDDEICAALALMFQDTRLALEPAAAAPLAALLGPLRETLAGKQVGLVICGTNLDTMTYLELLRRGESYLAAH